MVGIEAIIYAIAGRFKDKLAPAFGHGFVRIRNNTAPLGTKQRSRAIRFS